MTPPRVIGLGSHHGDDQAGWLVIDRLRDLGYPSDLLHKAANPVDLLDDLSSELAILICDACEGAGKAGSIHQWRWPTDQLQNLRSGGTHDLPLAQVLELAGQFADHPVRVEIWAMTGAAWIPAADPSEAVRAAAGEVAARIRRRYGA